MGSWMEQAKHLKGLEPSVVVTSAEEPKPTAPLQPGWLVVYLNRQGNLCGGADDRDHGTVDRCEWNGNGWRVLLTDGQQLGLSIIRAVGQTDAEGHLLAAWTVRGHGYDGQGEPNEGGR